MQALRAQAERASLKKWSAVVMAGAQRVSAVAVSPPFWTLLYARRLPSSTEGMDMEDKTLSAFEEWWLHHGQFCRAGGGDYEKTFAFRAWEAASARHDKQIKHLRDSLDQLLEIDKQLQDLLSSTRPASVKDNGV